MPLTVKECQHFLPLDKLYRKTDSNGLYLEIHPNGSKYWRFKYRYGGVEKRLALGVFPEVTLTEARDARDDARRKLRGGIDPGEEKKAAKKKSEIDTKGVFIKVANAWHAHKTKGWSEETSRKARMVIDTYLAPKLGHKAVSTITTAEVKPVLLAIHKTAPNLAEKARQYCNQIIQFAIQEGLREDGKLLTLKGVLPSSASGHMAAVTKHTGLPQLLSAISKIPGSQTRVAVLLCLYTAIRPGVAVMAEWSEFNDDLSEWHIPAGKMKGKNDHITPIPTQLRAHLQAFKKRSIPTPFVFFGERSPNDTHMHRDSLSKALREVGLKDVTVTHGFRATFRTIARERLKADPDVLEAQLAHAKKGEVQAAYDRTQFLEERHLLVQQWADYLDAQPKQATAA